MTNKRFFGTFVQTLKLAARLRAAGLRIVFTQGCFDLLHIGHKRFLEKAKDFGDALLVGVDSNLRVRKRKGPNRPIVNALERVELVAALKPVDFAFLRLSGLGREEILRKLKPDVFVITRDTHSKEELFEMQQYCHKVIELPRQATVSTTSRIEQLKQTRDAGSFKAAGR